MTDTRSAASRTWTLMLDFVFQHARPRMIEIWREFDLMPPQQLILGLLEEPRPMGELAQHMHCDNSNITGIVDRLEARGLVERRSAKGDRRVKALTITAAGLELRVEVLEIMNEPPEAIAALPHADQRALRDILARAVDLLRAD